MVTSDENGCESHGVNCRLLHDYDVVTLFLVVVLSIDKIIITSISISILFFFLILNVREWGTGRRKMWSLSQI